MNIHRAGRCLRSWRQLHSTGADILVWKRQQTATLRHIRWWLSAVKRSNTGDHGARAHQRANVTFQEAQRQRGAAQARGGSTPPGERSARGKGPPGGRPAWEQQRGQCVKREAITSHLPEWPSPRRQGAARSGEGVEKRGHSN